MGNQEFKGTSKQISTQFSNVQATAPKKRLLSVEETADYLGLSPRTLYNCIAPKAKRPFPVKPVRVGKLVRFDLRDLDKFIDSGK